MRYRKTEGSSSIWESNGLQNRRLRCEILPPLSVTEGRAHRSGVAFCIKEVRAFTSREGTLSGGVLVLNTTFEPLNIVSVRRAVVLLLKEKAEVIEAAQAKIRSESLALDMPLVIRLVYYVRVPHRLLMPLTRRTVLARDQYTCQYCGAQPVKGQLTLDHVLPRCRGGKHAWNNVVTACIPCNQRKGDRTLQEARMRLLRRPTRPRYAAVVLLGKMRGHEVWRKYIY
jgi:5-methylcytosine-specific restriction endonuclease McrA